MTKTPRFVSSDPNAADVALRNDILDLIRKHLVPNQAERVLAIASQVVGQALALQNPVLLGKDAALALIQQNIEKGNQDYVNKMLRRDGKPPMFPMN